jgi:hypothetical protein
MSKVDVDSSSKPVHGQGLCWAARIISILPAITPLVWITAHGIDAASAFGLFAFVALPAFIAWRCHIVGGLLLIIPAGLNLYLITVSLITRDPYAYFELDRSFVVRVILPIWTAAFVGGLLHIVAWCRERQSDRSPS